MMNRNKTLRVALLALAVTLPIQASASEGYSSLVDAAKAALNTSALKSTVREVGGCIYKLNGQFYFTDPSVSSDQDKFDTVCRFPVKAVLVGLYHTHPSDAGGEKLSGFFSKADVEMADSLEVPSFIYDLVGQQFRRYNGVSRVANRTDTRLIAGRVVE